MNNGNRAIGRGNEGMIAVLDWDEYTEKNGNFEEMESLCFISPVALDTLYELIDEEEI